MEFLNTHELEPDDLTEAAAIIVYRQGPYGSGWELVGFVTGWTKMAEATKFAVGEDPNLAGVPIVTKRLQRADLERAARREPPPPPVEVEIVVEPLPREPVAEPVAEAPASPAP